MANEYDPSDPTATRREMAAKARQRAYWRRRGQVKAMRTSGSPVEAARMANPALWDALIGALVDAESKVSDTSYVALMADVQCALSCANELYLRGTQLQLPLESE